MADAASVPSLVPIVAEHATTPRHPALVRITHWITFLCFAALLVTGIEIVISHPRFYWGEDGSVNTPALFQIPIPASRAAVHTGYGYVLPDQNGWSRSLHFEAAWVLVFAGIAYGLFGIATAHFPRNLFSGIGNLPKSLADHLRWSALRNGDHSSYNPLQRLSYVTVIFVLFPVMIWTGLAMSPAVVSAFPFLATALGGQQSARTVHFFTTIALVLFFLGHVAMVCVSGFRRRMRAMTVGGNDKEAL